MNRWLRSICLLAIGVLLVSSPFAHAEGINVTIYTGYVTGLHWVDVEGFRVHTVVLSKDINGNDKLVNIILSDLEGQKDYSEARDFLIAAYTTGTKVEVGSIVRENENYLGLPLADPILVSTSMGVVTPGQQETNPNEVLRLLQNGNNLLQNIYNLIVRPGNRR